MIIIFKIHFQQVNVLFYLRQFFLFKFFSLLSKSVLSTKFACFNFTARFSNVNLLNSGVVIYLS